MWFSVTLCRNERTLRGLQLSLCQSPYFYNQSILPYSAALFRKADCVRGKGVAFSRRNSIFFLDKKLQTYPGQLRYEQGGIDSSTPQEYYSPRIFHVNYICPVRAVNLRYILDACIVVLSE